MKRHKGSGRFGVSGGNAEDINPLDGVANLADVMLVFACGLMLALITYWNVDVAASVAPDVDAQPREITQDASDSSREDTPEQGRLEEYGTVYRDPETGRLYIIAED